jgi:5-methylphenazine-1-carboxylate 1-monooxygenase
LIIISGAGIAGLALAISCHQAGIAFKIFERAADILPLGVGINVQPHAVRELYDMGLEAELDRVGVRSRELVYFTKLGNRIWAEPRGLNAGYSWPQYSLHRGELQMMLYRKLLSTGNSVELSSEILDATENADGTITAHVKSGAETTTVTGDILVAADGIHSSLRKKLVPNEGAPVWGGAVLWRGTTRGPEFLGGGTVAYFGHQNQKFVTYPITPPDADGNVLINWIAELRFDPKSTTHRRESYNRLANLDDFLPQFEAWNFPWLDIPALIHSAPQCFEYPMVDRDPIESWIKGPMTLLGDAAHPMYPIGSNGASQAILDARILVRECLAHGVGTAALAAYEAERRPATNRLVLANRGNGPDQVMQIVEERCGGAFDNIEDVLSMVERQDIADRYKVMAGMDVASLNARPSTIVL